MPDPIPTLFLGSLLAFGLALLGVILGSRLADLRRRFERAEARAAALERRLRALEAGTVAPDVGPDAAPGPRSAEAHPVVEAAPAGADGTGDGQQTESPGRGSGSVAGTLPGAPEAGPAPPVATRSPAAGPALDAAGRGPAERGPAERGPAERGPAARDAGRPARERFEWERWLGVRGAGLLGGVVGALAAVLLFVHAVQEGWISPAVRVGGGVGFGLFAALVAERLHRRGYRAAADGLLGAGATAWFAALWAAAQRYELLPVPLAFLGMLAAVAWSAGSAWRHRSQPAALLLLGGGFATPLLLGGSEDRPWALFGHLALVDLALLVVVGRLARRWLGALAFLATAALQVLWLGSRFDADETGVALLVLGGFALLFGGSLSRDPRAGVLWRVVVDAPVPLALVLAGLFAARRGIELDPWLVAAFFTPLQVAARVLAERNREPWLPVVTALGGVGLLALLVDGSDGAGGAVGPALAAAVLAVGGASLVSPASLPGAAARTAAAVGALGAIWFAGQATLGRPSVEACWVLGAALTVALGAARLDLGRFGDLALALAFLPAAAVPADRAGWMGPPGPEQANVGLIALTLLAVAGLGWAVARGPRPVGARLAGALVVVATGGLLRWTELLQRLAPAADDGRLAPLFGEGRAAWLFVPGAIPLALIALAAAARRGRAWTAAAPLVVFAWALQVQVGRWASAAWSGGEFHGPALGAGLLAILWGLAGARAFPVLARSRAVGAAEGLAVLSLFAAALELIQVGLALDERADELVAALLVGGGALAGVARARRGPHAPLGLAAIGLAVACVGGVAAIGTTGIESLLLFLAAFALGAGLVGRWLGSALPRWAAVVAAALTAVGTVGRLFEPGGQLAAGGAPFDEPGLEHAVALLGAAVAHWARPRPAPSGALGRAPALAARSAALAAGLVGLCWISLTVLDRFSAGERLPTPLTADGAAGLALSLAWALVALALLALGVARGRPGARRASLAVLLLTLVKVFLVDLGDLEGLARVGSLAGLATSLILVSLAYQRFVLGPAQADPPGGSTSGG